MSDIKQLPNTRIASYEETLDMAEKVLLQLPIFDKLHKYEVLYFSHLNTEMVVVWADGKDVSEYTTDPVTGAETHTGPTVSAGGITLATAASNVVVGLPFQMGTCTDLSLNE